MSILNERIKQRREALGMSQAELAELLGYSDRSTIAKIEKGTNDITQSKIEAFAKALRTTPAYLMGWENDSGEQDLTLTALDVAKWLNTSPDIVESVMEDMGWSNATKPEALSKISAEVERRKICSVGQRIKEARKKVGLTQKELADRIGVSTTTIQQYELGKRQPRFEQAAAIADALGVTYFYLVTGEIHEKDPVELASSLDQKLKCVDCCIELTKPPFLGEPKEDEKAGNIKWIHFYWDGVLMVTDEELSELDESINNYLRFKLQELKEKHKDRFTPHDPPWYEYP